VKVRKNEGIYVSSQQLVAVTNALVKNVPQNSIDTQHNTRGYQIKDLSQIRCYKCHHQGHIARNCYNFNKKKRRPKAFQQDQGRSLSYPKIYRCMIQDNFP